MTQSSEVLQSKKVEVHIHVGKPALKICSLHKLGSL